MGRLVAHRFDPSALVEGDAFFGFLARGAIEPWRRFARALRPTLAPALAVLLACAGSLVLVGTALGAASPRPTWSLSEALPAVSGILGGLSCPSLDSCQAVSVSSFGDTTEIVGHPTAGKGWEVEGVPLGTDLDALSCATPEACQAVGESRSGAPVILGTADGGSHWTREPEPRRAGQPVTIACGSALFCVAGDGDGSGAQLTTDGGEVWSPPGLLSGPVFEDATCVSATTCYLVGLEGAGVIEETSDEGLAWARASLPASIRSVDTISCPSPSVCFATAATDAGGLDILETVDAGASWSVVAADVSMRETAQLSCASVTMCVALSGGPGADYFGRLYRSSDAGLRWRRLPVPGSMTFLGAVDCRTRALCRIVGATRSGTSLVEVSRDGGATWHDQPVPDAPAWADDVACSRGATTCVAAGTTSRSTGLLASSGDEGRSFAADSTGVAAVGFAAASCGSSTDCMAIGTSRSGRPVVVETGNSGATWHRRPVPLRVASLSGLDCTSDTVCRVIGVTAAGNGIVEVTTDAGASWSRSSLIHDPGGNGTLATISCGTPTTCMAGGNAAGPLGPVVETSDGGRHWLPVRMPPGQISTLTCVGRRTCFAADVLGIGTVIAKTVNFGHSWTLQAAAGGTAVVLQLSCASVRRCEGVATSDSDDLTGPATVAFGTRDGGRDWSRNGKQPSIWSISAVDCSAAPSCVGAGHDDPGGVAITRYNW